MAYYHDTVTEQSFLELKTLHRVTQFILIGGWATYFYTHALKSKDIDIIVEYDALPKLSAEYELIKNDRLKKYEARKDPVQIDVYLPHYSELGIPVEVLRDHASSVEGFMVLDKNYLTALKLHTLSERTRTSKGQKDFLDVVSLFSVGDADPKSVLSLLDEYGLSGSLKIFSDLLSETKELPELGMNAHAYGKFRRKTTTWKNL